MKNNFFFELLVFSLRRAKSKGDSISSLNLTRDQVGKHAANLWTEMGGLATTEEVLVIRSPILCFTLRRKRISFTFLVEKEQQSMYDRNRHMV